MKITVKELKALIKEAVVSEMGSGSSVLSPQEIEQIIQQGIKDAVSKAHPELAKAKPDAAEKIAHAVLAKAGGAKGLEDVMNQYAAGSGESLLLKPGQKPVGLEEAKLKSIIKKMVKESIKK